MPTPSLPGNFSLRAQGILFDMDGILISSIDSVERSWSKWAVLRNVDPIETCHLAHGRRAIETVAIQRPDLDPKAELKLIEEIEMSDGEGVQVLPGVLKLLNALPANRWTIVTSATEMLARTRLALVGIPVPQHFIHADLIETGKPHPMPYLFGASLLGIAPEDCIVFEDAPSGTQSGRAAGCTVVASTAFQPEQLLTAAHYFIRTLEQVDLTVLPDELLLTLTDARRIESEG